MAPLDDFARQPVPPLLVFDETVMPPWADKTYGKLGWDEDGERVYVSPRDRVDHLYRKYNGYAIDQRLIEDLHDADVRYALIRERESGDVYVYTPRQFVESSLTIDHEGFPKQKCVPTPRARWCWRNLGEQLWDENRMELRPDDVKGIRGQALKHYQRRPDEASS